MRRHPPLTMARQQKGRYPHQYGGNLPSFHGARIQRGYGLGSLFGSLARAVVPLFKRGAKTIGKAAVRTGYNIAKDVLSGQNIKTAARNRTQETGTQLINKAVKSVQSRFTPQTGAGLKRKRVKSANTSSQVKKTRTSPQRRCNKSKSSKKSKRVAKTYYPRQSPKNEDIFGFY